MSRFEKKARLRGLVMTFKPREQISINHGEVRIEVVQIKGSYVRLCFSAEKEIHILRLDDKTLAMAEGSVENLTTR